MKSIDAEIHEVEQRLNLRKAALGHTAGVLKGRALRGMASPLALAGALAVGFVVARGAGRRKARAPLAPVERRKQVKTQEQGKGFALGTLLMTGATWFIRSQFGGPVGLAQTVLGKLQRSRSQATGAPAQIPR
jgi:hypothetical protein